MVENMFYGAEEWGPVFQAGMLLAVRHCSRDWVQAIEAVRAQHCLALAANEYY